MAGLPQIDSLMGNASAPRAERRGKGLSFSPLIIMLLLVAAALICYGLVVCWSATSASTAHSFTRQLQGVAIGLVAMVVIWHIDYRRFANLSTFFLVVSIVLILLPHIPGLGTDAGMGAKSWIRVGMQIQPGEFAKVTIISVSYTHLDVYKRQGVFCGASFEGWRYCRLRRYRSHAFGLYQ